MAENVIRHDVVQIDFLSDGALKILNEMNEEIEAIKKALGAIDDSNPFEDMKKDAEKLNKPLKETGTEGKSVKEIFKEIGKTSFSALTTGLKKVGSEIKNVSAEAVKMGANLTASTAKLTAKGVVAASAGVGALVGASVNAYSDYEQLVGGVKTLFGTEEETVEDYAVSVGKSVTAVQDEYDSLIRAQNAVFTYANDAYKDAGLSANEYMETVTGFSASLLQSLDNDTEKAAVQSNKAIVDMSDNANKMGSDMENIMNAYQGFAKQNYTMLDNLKLGYGGTKTEMERLLADAGKLAGTTFDISSFNDIIEAIHVMQENMGIAGTTAKEASTTIQGSLSSLKSAWGNMLTAIVTGGDSFDQCIANLVDAAKTFGTNILPAIRGALEGVGTLIQELAPIITAELPGLVNEILPPLLSAAVTVVEGIISALPSIVNALITALPGILTQLIGAFGTIIPQLINTLKASLPSLVQFAGNMIKSMITGIKAKLPEFIESGAEMLTSLASGFSNNVDSLLGTVGDLLKTFLLNLASALPSILVAGYQMLASLVSGILRGIPNIIDTAGWAVTNYIMAFKNSFPQLMESGFELITSLIVGIVKGIPTLLKEFFALILAIGDLIINTDWIEVGKSIIRGIKNGIFGSEGEAKETGAEIASGISSGLESGIGGIDTNITFDAAVDMSDLESINTMDLSDSLTIDTSSISTATEDIVNQFNAIGENIRQLPSDIEGLLEPINTVVDKLTDMPTMISDAFGFLPNYSDDIAYMSDMVTELDNTLKKSGKSITKNIREMVINSRDAIVDEISTLPQLMGNAIRESGSALSSAVVEIWQNAVKAASTPINKLIEGANWILKQFGSSKTIAKWTAYAKGTEGHKGGNALVNDGRGAELIQMPNGDAFIPEGRDIFIPNAPKGMRVLSAEDTASLMGRKTPTFHYADGNFDIYDYIDNPGGLIEMVKSKYVNYGGLKGLALSLGESMVSTVSTEMISWVKGLFEEYPPTVDYDASEGVEQWRSLVAQALKMEGLYSESNLAKTLYQMQTESGGNPNAINNWDSNAKKGTPSKGLMQVIDPTFQAYARPGYNTNIYDPLSNILAAIRYADSRYGSLGAAFKGVGYADGGIAYKPSIFGEEGAEMAIPLKREKRDKGLSLWAQAGDILGADLSAYTPENAPVSNTNNVVEGDTYQFDCNITVNGSEKDRTTARYVKNAVKEGIQEFMDSFARGNTAIREY